MIFNDNGKLPFDYRYKISESNLVQVLKCDFTGDGMEDWVVEQCSTMESDDYRYSFWKQTADGSYEKIDCLQFIGLCAMPRMDGKGCGFLIVEREDLVITVDLLEFNGTGFDRTPVSAKPFDEIEPYEVRYHIGAPFIGSQFIGVGYGFGRRQLESKGVWFRPLLWPWKQGFVQSYEEAIRQAKAKR